MGSSIDRRPKDFSEVLGNSDTIEKLTALFSNGKNKIPHLFLFHGKSGCGKTTLARIIKTKLGCSDFDFYEYDTADNRGIDTVREIKQKANLKPMAGKTKIYLLDECHKMTSDGQNALLKITEEPPAHVYFILCTTDPEKLLPTLRNRATKYMVESVPPKRIMKYLTKLAEEDEAEVSEEAIENIVDSADGSVRDALNIYDQIKILPLESQTKAVEKIQKDTKQAIELFRVLLKAKSWNEVYPILAKVEDDPEKVRRAGLGYFSAVLLKGDNQRCALLIEAFKDNFYDSGKAGLTLACYQGIL